MGSISTGIGLISGIDSANIIEQLIQLERRPITTLQSRIAKTSTIQLAFAELSTRLNALKGSGTELRKPSTFEKGLATSSNESAIVAKAGVATAEGSYAFRVARLVSSQQLVTSGFATANDTPVGAGTISVELGDARLDSEPTLDEIRGGQGVRRGVMEITDRSGRISRVDLSDAVTLQDVMDRVNEANGAQVSLQMEGDSLVLTDISGGTGSLKVRDVTGNAAEDLGLLADTTTNSVTGSALSSLARDTLLAQLNDGRGVATGSTDGMTVTLRDGSSFDVDLSLARTVGEVVDRFNTAANGSATLELDGQRFRVVDTTGGVGATTVGGLAGSSAASDLGLDTSSTSGTLTGRAVVARVGSVLLSSLKGGTGFDLSSTLSLTNRAGVASTIDLSGTEDIAGVIEAINDSGAGVLAKLNSAGNGIDLIDQSGTTGTLTVDDSPLAQALGLVGSFETGTARGADLDRAWLHGQSLLSDLNNGRGINLGEVRITDSNGSIADFKFNVGTFRTVQDVLNEFNRADSGVSINARLNDTGDGIVIEDTAGGTQALKIADEKGGTAKDLRLAGEHTTGTIDGSFELNVEVTDTDSLEDIRNKLNDLSANLRVEVLNTGTGSAPYRLSVVGRESGQLGGFVFDARLGDDGTALTTTSMSRARDAALLFGGDGAESPLLVTSGTNTVEGVIPGLSLDLKRAGNEVVTVTVEQDFDAVLSEVDRMVNAFNDLREMVDKNTDFNTETEKRGPLLGEPSVQKIERQLYNLIDRVYDTGNPRYRILADVGVRIADGAKLEFDEDAFRAAWADDAEAVKQMFSAAEVGFGYRLQDTITAMTDPADGLLTKVNQTLQDKTSAFEDQIGRLEETVAAKRMRLEKQFLDMELALSRLQFQQQQIGQIPQINYQSSQNNN